MYWIALLSEIERQFIFIAILAFQSLYTLGLNEEKSTCLPDGIKKRVDLAVLSIRI